MKYFILDIITKTVTFRNPEFQNFHKTLDLPPPTTIIGFAGAALGLSPKASQEFFETDSFEFGVYGRTEGKVKDTWKYTNKTKGAELYNYHPDFFGSIITKEILFINKFYIAFGTDNNIKYDQLFLAFQSPKFALTLGNSDSLAFIKTIIENPVIENTDIISHCMIEGDVIGEVFKKSDINFEFSIYENSEPIAYDLPTRYYYKEDYSARTVENVNTYSIIGDEMKLNYKIRGISYKNIFIPLNKL